MLKCRIKDSTFSHDRSATAWKIPKHIEWVRDDVTPTNGPNFYVDGFILTPTVESIPFDSIAWLHEPEELIPRIYDAAPVVAGMYATTLTYHPDLCGLPGFTWCPYGGCWLPESEWGLQYKTELCSMLVGFKLATSGHRLRRETALLLAQQGQAVDFFGSIGTPTDYSIGTKLTVNAPAAFTIVTETQMLDGLWTEWLLDALAVGTVPIYAGSPNIGRWFNPAGILAFTTPAECAEIVAGLSWELYNSMLPAVADNLARVGQYAVAEDWMYDNVLKEYDK